MFALKRFHWVTLVAILTWGMACSSSGSTADHDGSVTSDAGFIVDTRLDSDALHQDGLGADAIYASFADEHTVALWLFDELQYPYVTLTDASRYEHDLRLMEAGTLVPGRFGRALKVKVDGHYNISYAGWQGAMINEYMKAPKGKPSGLWGPTGEPRKILDTLAGNRWTLELWLKLDRIPASNEVILDLGHAYLPGVMVQLTAGAVGVQIHNSYNGVHTTCPTNAALLSDLKWHHLAFTNSGGSIAHYVDGVLQAPTHNGPIPVEPLPGDSQPTDRAKETRGFTASAPDAWRRENRFNIALGEDRKANGDLDGLLDEIRLSDVVRYNQSFPLVGSLSRNHGDSPSRAAVPTGPPLLFHRTHLIKPVQLGSRKHVFIDDVLLETKSALKLKVNPVTTREDLSLTEDGVTKPFQPPAGMWRETVYDHNGKVYLFIADGYSSKEGITRLYTSNDGIHFTAPDLGVIEYEGSTHNNFIMYGKPMGSVVFKDTNPNIDRREQFKISGWSSNRGAYLYVSADGIHWRRNECGMLPLASGGDVETFWDDQRGLYMAHLKRDSGSNTADHPGYGKRGVLFKTAEPFKPWPMQVLQEPYFEGWPFPMLSGEGPVTFPIEPPIIPFVMYYDVYRTRAMKYPWAPDTYVAFYWAGFHHQLDNNHEDNKRRRTRIAVSRDGETWKYYKNTWYIDSIGQVEGQDARDGMSLYGLIRRKDEIWHYAEFSNENNGNGDKQYSRLKQGLDRFIALDAGPSPGMATTHPLIFSGSKLQINAQATGGYIRVGLLDAQGNAIPRYSLDDCTPYSGDHVRHTVSWTGGANVSGLSGQPVRVRFELTSARIYAFQFVP